MEKKLDSWLKELKRSIRNFRSIGQTPVSYAEEVIKKIFQELHSYGKKAEEFAYESTKEIVQYFFYTTIAKVYKEPLYYRPVFNQRI